MKMKKIRINWSSSSPLGSVINRLEQKKKVLFQSHGIGNELTWNLSTTIIYTKCSVTVVRETLCKINLQPYWPWTFFLVTACYYSHVGVNLIGNMIKNNHPKISFNMKLSLHLPLLMSFHLIWGQHLVLIMLTSVKDLTIY